MRLLIARKVSIFAIVLGAIFFGFGGIRVAMAAGEVVTVYVPRTVIYPGDVISDDMLVERKVYAKPAAPPPFGMRREEIVGKSARRTLLRGQFLVASALREPEVITQGRTYVLLYRSPFLVIRGSGVPLQSGGVGEIVNVRNPDTGVVVKARVASNATLVVDVQ